MEDRRKGIMNRKKQLWYKQEASKWIEALPVGNGRLGAMVYGGSVEERIQVDESSFWSGEESEANNRSGTIGLMQEIRGLLAEENYEEADRIGHGFIGNKNNYGTNMPVADLLITLEGEAGEITEYERSLSFSEGIAVVGFKRNGTVYEREVLVSNPAQAIAVCMKADQPFSLSISYGGIGNNTEITAEKEGIYQIAGDAREKLHSDGNCGVHLEGVLQLECNGKKWFEDGSIKVEGCSRVVIYMDLETTMFHENPAKVAGERVREAGKKGWEALRAEHIRDVLPMYERVHLTLSEEPEENGELPTDQRIKRAAAGISDNGLISLLFQYGRYLLIASSRADSILPTHMGGIWNDNIYNNIDCTQDMHLDMNLQMQYWAAAQCALPECYRPALDYIEKILMPSGAKTAKEVYGAKGWTAHVVSNPWGFTSLGWSYNWGAWSLGGAWCAALAWDYYEYTQDKEWLSAHGYPIIEGAAAFVADYVFFDDKRGLYMTGPSYSPENMFRTNGKDYFLSLSNTCDVILVREILNIWQKAAELLQVGDKEQLRKVKEIQELLPPYQIGAKGQLQEWFYDFEEAIPNHRHTSHLLGLYPFGQIQPEAQPQLAKAAEQSIRLRCEEFEITSWGMNMLAGYYARLSNGEKALEVIKDTIKRLVKPNLASVMSDETSMWCGTWELDGNTGLTAVIAEMLVQSLEGEMRILPALPAEWKNGSLTGIALKGGHHADIFWEEGELAHLVIYPGRKEKLLLNYRGKTAEAMLVREPMEFKF